MVEGKASNLMYILQEEEEGFERTESVATVLRLGVRFQQVDDSDSDTFTIKENPINEKVGAKTS